MDLPADGHTHSEWSWDTDRASMDGSCARAIEAGVPVIAFTEHLDFTPFRAGDLEERFGRFISGGVLRVPALDVDGYLESVARCRAAYPELRILTGLEIGQPHLHAREVADVLAKGTFDRVLGSLHCLRDEQGYAEPGELFTLRPAADVFREYLQEIPTMVAGSDVYQVFTHIDYPVRYWPDDQPPFDPHDFEDDFRPALRTLAEADLALEFNTKLPLDPAILTWWHEEGGRQLTFGSDAHTPDRVGHGLSAAAEVARSHGFHPAASPTDPWTT
ncbi:PHP domain-containing protein [Kribbella sp. NPDC055071]